MTVGLGLSVVGVRMGSGRRGRRVGDGSCRSPPTPAVAVEEIDVVDDLALQQPVELLRVDAVGSLDLAVQPRCAGLDADVSDALVQQMAVTGLAELLAAVGLNLVNRDRSRRARRRCNHHGRRHRRRHPCNLSTSLRCADESWFLRQASNGSRPGRTAGGRARGPDRPPGCGWAVNGPRADRR